MLLVPRILLASVLLFAGATASATISAWAQGTVQRGGVGLHVSEGRMLNLDRDAKNVMVGDGSIADVQAVSPRQLYVYGRKPGLTTLTAIDSTTGNAAQLTINVTRSGAAAQGTIPSGSAVSIGFDQNRLVVRGRVADLGQALEANSTAQQFNAARQPPLDRTRLAGAQQITLHVRVAEVSRSTLNQLGLNLNILANPGSFAFGLMTGSFLGQAAASTLSTSLAGGTPTNSFGNLAAGVSGSRVNGNAVLNALQSEGLLITLAEPNLTTISGETASFRAGGEIPIPVPQALGVTTIEYKRYGVQLTFTPVLLPDNRIAMKVHPSVSEISSANAITIGGVSVPSLIDRDAETQVEMASGQTLSIAGLFQRNEQANISKFPGLGDIPIIGALFRSTSYQHNETELVILVTPYLSQPVSNPNAYQVPSQAPASPATPTVPAPVAAGFVAN